jgi:addiction module RelE/StbE family toxin
MNEAFRVNLSPQVFNELNAIYEYISRDSSANAAAMVETLLDAMNSLQSLPHRCGIFRRQRGRRRDIRRMPVPPYVIYYYVMDTDRIVRISSVRHGSRRQPRLKDLN